MADINLHHGAPRSSCTAGRSGFLIHSNGDVSRCAAMYYGPREVIGNVTDPSFLEGVRAGASIVSPCPAGWCVAECDGHHYSQTIVAGGGLVRHEAERSVAKGLVGKRHCNLQLNITSTCNYSCSYCSAEDSMRRYAGLDLDAATWISVAEFFTDVFPAGNVSMLGGEPTVHPGLRGCASAFLGGGWHVDLFTNLSMPRRVLDLIEASSGRERLFVIVSIHPTQKRFSAEAVEEAVLAIGALGVSYGYTFVATPENEALDASSGIMARLCAATSPAWTSRVRNVRGPMPGAGVATQA
jgi:MoaA/NifB/PqqE/SkfB family radical SAM enzyme